MSIQLLFWRIAVAKQKVFVFNYQKYKSKKISIVKLDNLMDQVINAGTSRWASIVAGIKVILFFAYLWARRSMIDEEFQIAKQNYERNRAVENSDIIFEDDLD